MSTNTSTLHFTSQNFKEEVLQSETPVLVDFWAEWCGPCHALTPVIDELAGEYNGNAKIGKLNVDDSPEIARAYNISSIPTVVVFKGSEVVDVLIGIQPKQSYIEALNRAGA